jgi:hypothetical protein
MTKAGLKKPNYWGSITQSGTLRIGNYEGEEVYTPFKSLVPMADPNSVVLGGWDISGLTMAEAMERAQVLDFELQKQLVPYMKDIVPLPGEPRFGRRPAAAAGGAACACAGTLEGCARCQRCRRRRRLPRPGAAPPCLCCAPLQAPFHPRPAGIYNPDFIAANQEARADNCIKGSKAEQLQVVRGQIRAFKQEHGLEQVVVLWTANTERYAQVGGPAAHSKGQGAGAARPPCLRMPLTWRWAGSGPGPGPGPSPDPRRLWCCLAPPHPP